MLCSKCGSPTDEIASFCSSCGQKVDQYQDFETNIKSSKETYSQISATETEHTKGVLDQVRSTFSQATQKINSMVGEEGNIQLDLRYVFSAVLKKHTKEEGELLFTAGTVLSTPNEKDISSSWPRPWLFSRVFVVFAITYALLFICTYLFNNTLTIPGLIIIGSFAVPFSLLIFFWETNVPRNISIYEISKMFFMGGTSSLVITLFLYSFFPINGLNVIDTVVIGFIEEVGKLAIIAYFINKINPKYILNGLLIGAAIGAGFASFESAGYAFNFGLTYGGHEMLSVIFSRACQAIGTHTVWAAISGAALVYVKRDASLHKEHFFNIKFFRLFIVPIILHALWDSPLQWMHNLRFIILIVVAWIFVFTFINAGLKQIMRLNTQESPHSISRESV